MIEFAGGNTLSDPQVMRVDTFGTGSFMSFINFGGKFLGGGMSTGDQEDGVDLVSTDWSSVEIRFGNGLNQKAHRFTVPVGEGAGVPPEDYSYQDYVDVPIQAWDTDHNRQLMISGIRSAMVNSTSLNEASTMRFPEGNISSFTL